MDELLRDVLRVEDPSPHVERAARIELAAAMQPGAAPQQSSRSGLTAPRRRAQVASALVAAAIVGGAVLAVALTWTSPARTPIVPKGRARVLTLADYRLTLPRGFVPRSDACLPSAPPGIGGAVTVLQAMRAAASQAGGCLEATVAAGAVEVPSDAQPVVVGTESGDYDSGTGGTSTLYVAVPAAQGAHYLVLSAQGLSESELIAIAASAFPAS